MYLSSHGWYGFGNKKDKNTSFQSPHHHVWNGDDGLLHPIFSGYIRFRKGRNCINLSSRIYAKGVDFCSSLSHENKPTHVHSMFMKSSIWSGYVDMLGFDTFQNLEKISFNYIFSDCHKAYTLEMQNGWLPKMRVWKKKLLRRFDLSTSSVQSYKFPCHFQKNIHKTTKKTKTITFTQTTLDSTPTRARFYINGHCLLIFICWKYEV